VPPAVEKMMCTHAHPAWSSEGKASGHRRK
jgi:hypothetical protein